MIEDFADRRPQRRQRLLGETGQASSGVGVTRSPGRFVRKRSKWLQPLFSNVVLLLAALIVVAAAAFVIVTTLQVIPEITSSNGLSHQRLSQPKLITPLVHPRIEAIFRSRINHTVSKGETLGTIFKLHGLPTQEASQIHEELKQLSKREGIPSSIALGQILSLIFSENGELHQLQSSVSKDVEFFLTRSEENKFVGRVNRLPKIKRERVVAGEIETSFATAANGAGLPYDAIDNLVDLFSDRIAFHRDFRKGDRFSLIYQDTVLEDGTSIGAGTILAAALEVDNESYVAVRYAGVDGVARYFDGKGEVLGNSFLRYPLKFTRISSTFSKSRFHPVLKRRRPHNGVDFAAPTGTPVRSVADGKVMFAGRKGGGGLTVKIRHTSRYSTAYLHLSKIAKGIRKGVRVTRGQRIGAVGMTGLATGPHLHYSFYDRGKYVDPLKIKLPKVERLKKGQKIDDLYLKRVLYTLDHYQQINLNDFYWQ